jgi:hypothetical protein
MTVNLKNTTAETATNFHAAKCCLTRFTVITGFQAQASLKKIVL